MKHTLLDLGALERLQFGEGTHVPQHNTNSWASGNDCTFALHCFELFLVYYKDWNKDLDEE